MSYFLSINIFMLKFRISLEFLLMYYKVSTIWMMDEILTRMEMLRIGCSEGVSKRFNMHKCSHATKNSEIKKWYNMNAHNIYYNYYIQSTNPKSPLHRSASKTYGELQTTR